MKKVNNATLIAIVLIITSLFQGCSDNNSTKPKLETISLGEEGCSNTFSENTENDSHAYGKLNIEINNNDHFFIFNSTFNDTDLYITGKILTYDYPKTVNVYKISSLDDFQSPFANPIKKWKSVSFQTTSLLMGKPKYKNNMKAYDQLSRLERVGVIQSMTRMSTTDLREMETIQAGYPKVIFTDYVLKSTFPAVNSNLYEITAYDIKLNCEVVIDTIKDRPVDYYVIRRSVDGITVGLPSCIDLHYEKYNEISKTGTEVINEDMKMFFDGVNIYEVHNNTKIIKSNMDIYMKDKKVLSFEQACDKASSYISQLLSDSMIEGRETYIYAAELVYLTVLETDNNTYEAYLYPFWIIYIQSNYMSVGEDIADHQPLLVNAVTGEVVVCN